MAIVIIVLLAVLFKIILVIFYRHQKKVLNVKLPEAHNRLYFGMKAIEEQYKTSQKEYYNHLTK